MSHSNIKVDLKDIVSNSLEGIIITTNAGTIKLVNKVSLSFFSKLTSSDLIERSIKDFVFSKELDRFFEHKQEMRNISLMIGMNQLLANFRFIDSTHILISFKNVTQIRQLENELNEVNGQIRLFNKILDNISDGICFINNEGRIIFYNNKMGELDSEEPLNIRGENYTYFLKEEDPQKDPLQNSLKTDREIIQNEAFFANSGKRYDVVRYSKPLFLGSKKIGALNVVKDHSKTKLAMDNILRLNNRNDEAISLPQLQSESESISSKDIIFSTSSMMKVVSEAKRAAKSTANILIYGDSGVGKSLLVDYIRYESRQTESPFYSLNCGAIPDHLLGEALFGNTNSKGLFELANGGTIFLDELNSIGIPLQEKIVRVLNNKKLVTKNTTETPIDIRFIASMNVTPALAFEKKYVIEDLLYLLGVVTLRIPLLKERKTDIPILANHFMNRKQNVAGSEPKVIGEEAMNLLLKYDYPGNVRQLAHIIEGTVSILEDEKVILPDHLPKYLQSTNLTTNEMLGSPNPFNESASSFSLIEQVEAFEKDLIKRVLKNTNYHITNSAEVLGLSRQSLNYKIKKYDLSILRGGS